MSNQYARQFNLIKEPSIMNLWAYVTIGAAGAPTLVKAKSKGIKSIARNSSGDYTITLTDSYNGFCYFELTWDESANGPGNAPAAPQFWVKAYNVGTVGAGTIEFVCGNNSSVATDPASTEAMLINIHLKNSSAF
jgi:hypothetical protein